MMHIYSTDMLATALRDQRKRAQITQSTLAEHTGLKQATISALENQPDGTKLETLFKLLSALDLELHLVPKAANKTTGWEQEW
ncbi:MAG: helix-turn-helix domain-containing protein [Thiofilum sp.]|uniref:helix-turn-helix domain-containing protein n=1 Tax=Thiofilum sp. TaxID=2212733 RepID=UPI0025D7E8A8|nr:helix-turn-helix domain-containing protein [Thiofilum sp.]